MSGLFSASELAHFQKLLDSTNISELNFYDDVNRAYAYLKSLNRGLIKQTIIELAISDFIFKIHDLTDWQKILVLNFAVISLYKDDQSCLLFVVMKMIEKIYPHVSEAKGHIGKKLFKHFLDCRRFIITDRAPLSFQSDHYQIILAQLPYFDVSEFRLYKKRHLINNRKLVLEIFMHQPKVHYLLTFSGIISGNTELKKYCFSHLGRNKDINTMLQVFKDFIALCTESDRVKYDHELTVTLAMQVAIILGFRSMREKPRIDIELHYDKFSSIAEMLQLLNERINDPSIIEKIDTPLLLMIHAHTLEKQIPVNKIIKATLAEKFKAITPRVQKAMNFPFVRLLLIANQSPFCAYITSHQHPAATHCRWVTLWPDLEKVAAWQRIHIENFKTDQVDESKRCHASDTLVDARQKAGCRVYITLPSQYLMRLFNTDEFDFHLKAAINFVHFRKSQSVIKKQLQDMLGFCQDELSQHIARLRVIVGIQDDPIKQADIMYSLQRIYRSCCLFDLLKNHPEIVPYKLKFTRVDIHWTNLGRLIAGLKEFFQIINHMKSPQDICFNSPEYGFTVTLKAYFPNESLLIIPTSKKKKPAQALEGVAKRRRVLLDEPDMRLNFDRKQVVLDKKYGDYLVKSKSTESDIFLITTRESVMLKYKIAIFSHRMSHYLDLSAQDVQKLVEIIDKAVDSAAIYAETGALYALMCQGSSGKTISHYICSRPADVTKNTLLKQVEKKLHDFSEVIEGNCQLRGCLLNIYPVDAAYKEKLKVIFESTLRAKVLSEKYTSDFIISFKETATAAEWATTIKEMDSIEKDLKSSQEVLTILTGAAQLLI